jgi:hypothetical protein
MSSAEEMPSAAPVTIVPLSGNRLASAREVFASSHADYPAWRHVFPDPRQRQRALSAFFAATVRDAFPFGAVDAAVANGEVLGFAVWLPQGVSRGARRASSGLPRRCWVCCVPRQPAFGTSLGLARTPSTYFRRTHTGIWRRWASGKMRRAAESAPVSWRPASPGPIRRAYRALTTARKENLAFYGRFGFEVSDDALPLVPNGPTAWGMRRPPMAGED